MGAPTTAHQPPSLVQRCANNHKNSGVQDYFNRSCSSNSLGQQATRHSKQHSTKDTIPPFHRSAIPLFHYSSFKVQSFRTYCIMSFRTYCNYARQIGCLYVKTPFVQTQPCGLPSLSDANGVSRTSRKAPNNCSVPVGHASSCQISRLFHDNRMAPPTCYKVHLRPPCKSACELTPEKRPTETIYAPPHTLGTLKLKPEPVPLHQKLVRLARPQGLGVATSSNPTLTIPAPTPSHIVVQN